MPRQPLNWVNVLLLFCLVGEGLVLYCAVALLLLDRRRQQEAGFHPVEATVNRVEVREWPRGRSARAVYSPQVRFRYRVNDGEYEAVFLGGGTAPTREEAEQSARAQYPAGRRVEAFYDPSNPADAVLARDRPLEGFWGFLLGCTGVPFLLLLPGCVVAVRRLGRSVRGWWKRSVP